MSSSRLAVRAGAAVLVLVAATWSSVARAQTATPQEPAASWHDGDPVPAGYRRVLHPRRDLLAIGASLFVLPYMASAIAATTGYPSDASTDSTRTVMWVPAVGPFVMLGSSSSAAADLFLVLDGLAQLGGLSLFVYSLATPRASLLRDEPERAATITIAPVFARGVSGAALVGRF